MKVLSPRQLQMKSPSKTLRYSRIQVNKANKRNTNTVRIEGKASIVSSPDHRDHIVSRSSRKVFEQAQKKGRDTSIVGNPHTQTSRYVSPPQAQRISLSHYLNKH